MTLEGRAGGILPPDMHRNRRIIKLGVDLVFPAEVQDPENSLERAGQLVEDGYGLLAVFAGHFSAGEFNRVISSLSKNPVLRGRNFVMGIGYHEFTPTVDTYARSVGVRLMPVSTESTRQILGPKAPRLFTGLDEYFQAFTQTVGDAGIGLVVPQGGRKARLGQPGTLMGDILREIEEIEKVAVLTMGVGLSGRLDVVPFGGVPKKPDYHDKGFHIKERYIIKMIKTRVREELLAEVKGETIDEKYDNLDPYLFEEFRANTPAEYH